VLGGHPGPHDPGNLTAPFGSLGNTLVAPAARWDSYWYLLIAQHGYAVAPATTFYPLYPLLAAIVGAPFGFALIGGVIVSLAALLAALYFLHRLVTLELGPELATRTTLLLAFWPTAVFFSAVYTEGLFLALSIGSIYAARKGNWAWAGIAGGLTAATRPVGFVLIIPLVLLYLYGPRSDAATPVMRIRAWAPRYRPQLSLLWLLVVPAGIGAYMLYLAIRFGNPLFMVGQGSAWHMNFTLPPVAIWNAAHHAANGVSQAIHGHFPRNIYEFGYVCLALVACVGALRRLPFAYAAYAVAGALTVLCFPVAGWSLSGFSRYMAPLFPIFMWLAMWTSERRLYKPLLAVLGLLMMVYSARFATWHFVA
jgi:hypothetical protein